MPNSGLILVLAEHPMIAALVGLLVETCGRQPAFAEPGERPNDALHRLRPVAVVLVGVELTEAHSDLFFAAAARAGTRVTVFGPGDRAREIAEVAAARGIGWFTLPPRADALAAAIAPAVVRVRDESRGDRRSEARTTFTADGTPIFFDRGGTAWIVYDRRGGADRRTDREGAIDRFFVSGSGERCSCMLQENEVGDESANALERQLARALGE